MEKTPFTPFVPADTQKAGLTVAATFSAAVVAKAG